MRISELVKHLEWLQKIHGDLRVTSNSPDYVGSKYCELTAQSVTIEEGVSLVGSDHWRDYGEADRTPDDATIRPLVVIG